MENVPSTPAQNVNPVVPAQAPVVAAPTAMVAKPAVAAPVVSKPAHTRLYVLLAVFAVLGGVLATIGVAKPEMITSTFAWVTKTPMHAAPAESLVLVNGQWVSTSNPEAELSKIKVERAPVKKPEPTTVVETSVVVPEAPAAPAVEGVEPAAPAEVVPAADAEVLPETPSEGAFDLKVGQSVAAEEGAAK